MFIGHFAVGFASKRFAPRASLGALMAASTLLDLLWPLFVLAGIEVFRIAPGNTRVTPLEFISYPYSHSLVASAIWAGLFAAVYWMITRYRAGSVAIALGVISHWFLDFVSHGPDMPLLPSGGPKLGLGLWNSPVGTAVVEGSLFALCLALYLKTTRATGRAGSLGLLAFVSLLLVSYVANFFGPPPPSEKAVAIVGVVTWIIPVWCWWIDRGRGGVVRFGTGGPRTGRTPIGATAGLQSAYGSSPPMAVSMS